MKPISFRPAALAGVLLALVSAWSAGAQNRTNPCETVLVFGTGTSASGALLRPGSVDPFFAGASANFPARGDAVVATPVPTAWLASGASPDSQWIAPTLNPADSGIGTYLYRLSFNTPCAGAVVIGRYAAGDRGALRLNGGPVSFPTPSSGAAAWTTFSFSGLPAGANTLEFYVTNAPAIGAAGPTGLRAELAVTATCCPCIVLTCPEDAFVTTCSNVAPVNFTISGTNRCYTNLTIVCRMGALTGIPVTSGSLFPVGTNFVTCTATDTVGHATNCTFRVVVRRDAFAPEIRCPRDIVYLCGVGGTNVFYSVPVTDDADAAPVVTCNPPSGSFFSAGTNTVNCEARDACGRISRCAFRVILAPDGFTKVYQAGVADDFSLAGFEVPSPGPCLGSSGYWSGLPFDTSWPGRHASHSFQGLPANIIAARLIVRLQPTLPASQDDMVRLGLLNCGGGAIWAFAQPISALPASGGSWNTNGPTTFDLDLSALPGGLNLLAQLNADHRLEYAIGTETRVDYARLDITHCGPLTTVSGVPYSLNNVYPVHRGEGVSWRTVNSNDPPVIDFDTGFAEGIRFNFDDLVLVPQCVTPGTHHGLTTVWPTGEGTTATLSFKPSPLPNLTRIEMAQPSNQTGKAIEVWNAGQLVTRYFLAGNGDTVVNVPSSACLQQMGFTTAYFFANFEEPISVQILTGTHVSGQAGGIATGDTVRMYYVVTVNAATPNPRIVRVNLPLGGWSIAGMSLLHQGEWFDAFGPQQTTISDTIISSKLADWLQSLYGNCINAVPGWSLNLQNPVGDFCTWDGLSETCTGGYVDLNIKAAQNNGLNFGGLRLTPTVLPLDVCRIENTVANSTANSVTVQRVVGGPLTLNNVTSVEALHWPVKISGNAGPQSFVVDLPPDTTVTVGGQTYAATRVTFHASPLVLTEFYKVCLETVNAVQISMQSFVTPPPAGGIHFQCLTLNCPTGAVANCLGAAGTPVTFSVSAATRCGANAVVQCEPASGSLFPPGVSFVHCVGTDSQGNREECRFPVTVRDVNPPRLVTPARLIEPCTGPRGALVNFTASAVDACDPAVVVECRPPSGSVFPEGTNYVTCTAVDAAGNRASHEFPVIVTGGCATTRCIDVTVPADLSVRCNAPGGAVVTYVASARETCTGGQLAVTCLPASGSVFPVGETRVVCTARSGAGEASASFLIEVTDDVAPVVECPSDLVVPAQSARGAIVPFQVTGRDDCAPTVRVRCTPPSGSVFPVGTSLVVCEAADGHGNVGRCTFQITVRAPEPLRMTAGPGGSLVLRWVGDAVVEATDVLTEEPEPVWLPVPGRPTSNGVERSLQIVPTSAQRFFRLQVLDLLPEQDGDGDGVPDSRDRCPRTPTGMAVDAQGCALIELLTEPEEVLEPTRGRLNESLRQLVLDGGFKSVVSRISPWLVNSNSPSVPLSERQPGRALELQSGLVSALRAALAEFQATKPGRVQELLRGRAALTGEHADVRPQDFELMRLEDVEAALIEAAADSEQALDRLNAVARSLLTRERRTLRVEGLDGLTGRARLSDGRLAVLPGAMATAAPALTDIPCVFNLGSPVVVEVSLLPDGVWFVHDLSPAAGINPNLVYKLDPRCLSLRIVPANPSLPDWDTGVRHRPKGYKWGYGTDDGYHFLEYGMALAVVKVGCQDAPGTYRHWVQLRVDHNNDGNTSLLADSIDENSPPRVLKPGSLLPEFRLFPLVVREFRAPIYPDGSLGTSEVLGEETYLIELYPWGYFGTAEYSRTLFELRDRPDETGHQNAQVVDIQRNHPLTMQSLGQQNFRAWSFTPSGAGSSYPDLNPIVLNQGFAVHTKDPNDISFFAYTNDVGRGLYSPTISGVNRGRPFSYRVTLPTIVRDRLHNCSVDSFYRIPLFGEWEVSQGNNGQFTHNGNQKYAFDFPDSTGTFILAARGGVVVDLRKTSCYSCWDPDAINEDGDEGDCVNCTGVKSANFVKIRHQDGTAGVYFHMKKGGVQVTKGQRIYRGDILGKIGTTGCSTGPHLHFHVTEHPDTGVTIPVRFETYDDDDNFRECYLPPHDSDGISTNFPWFWPF